MSATKALLLLSIITYSMSPVTCIKCYNCDSWENADCEKNPKNVKDADQDCAQLPFSSDECATVIGKKDGKDGLVRTCSSSSGSDDDLKMVIKAVLQEFTPEKVTQRCKTDLCNVPSSGSHLSIGLWSLIGAFLSLSIGKP